MTILQAAKLRAFARAHRAPTAWDYFTRVAGTIDAITGTITWTPNAPWTGPITPITVDEFLLFNAKGADRDHA